jgi:hypothetical protein
MADNWIFVGGTMKRLASSSAAIMLFTAIALRGSVSRGGQQKNNTPMSFTGEVMDNECGTQQSHDAMVKKEGYKNGKECTLGCVAAGGKFVLYAVSNKTVYQLDDQDKTKEFAGLKVTIIGTYDGETKTIRIQSIQAVP